MHEREKNDFIELYKSIISSKMTKQLLLKIVSRNNLESSVFVFNFNFFTIYKALLE